MKYIYIVLAFIALNVKAATDEPHPIIDSNYISKYSYNLDSMETDDLQKTKLTLKEYLNKRYSKNIETKESMEKKLLNSLLEYDDVRIQISKVLDEVVIEYDVSEDIKKTILDFKDTFDMIIKDNRPLVKNLRDYKAYDFRLGSAYLAMMSAFHDTDEKKIFYSRLVKDKKDDKTSIGKYNKKLKLAQQKVNLVKQEMNNFSELSEIKSVIKKIDIEISKRK
jgi:hypothetical protein|tara:strand:+ start:1902 stop:2567 length:666 start_codon:yes stop_codon:yes gene_type:complete